MARLVQQHEGDLIEAGLSEAAGRLSAMAKVPALGMRLRHQGLERGAEHDGGDRKLTWRDFAICPDCGGAMQRIAIVPRSPPPPFRCDTS